MGWIGVPCLVEGRSQLNKRFPKRDKGAEGMVGDLAHQSSKSSHNPDRTGNPEYRDGDSKDEVRAVDFDKDLRDSKVTMEQVVQLWITKLRAGKMKWIRYIIFNGRIWSRSDNFKTHTYTGSNKHSDHAHVNSDFNNYADTVTGTDWFLSELDKPVVAKPATAPVVIQKGASGKTVTRIQQFFKDVFPAYRDYVSVKRKQMIAVDGEYGAQTASWVMEFQARTHLKRTGKIDAATLKKMKSFGYKY